ncbi:MAG: BamA/TamA family outer membrane protein [Flavobacteriaceae bacterium]|nr:BamA/TamA family outer membrane protein [Flavobacteriaceae bacterium]
MLTHNYIYVDGDKNADTEVNSYLIQHPNQRFLGLPLGLYFYNLGNKDFENDYSKWRKEHPNKYPIFKKIFSEKQVYAYRNFQKTINDLFLKPKNAPELVNAEKTKQTVRNLQQYFYNLGYLKTKVTADFQPYDKKKAKIIYRVTRGKPYVIDSIKTIVESKILDSIYKNSHLKSSIKKGQNLDISYFFKEREKLTKLFRNSGIYRFNKNAIIFDADSTQQPHKVNIEMAIGDSIANKPFKVQRINKVKIYTDYSYKINKDSIKEHIYHDGYEFLSMGKLAYNPHSLLHAVFIKPKSIYSDEITNLTRLHLRDLNNFKMVDIRYKELPNDSLEASIYLTPQKKYSVGLNSEVTHSNIRELSISGKLSILDRNVFKGAEILKLSVQGSFLDAKDAAKNDRLLNAWELGADISFEIPRFFLPFNVDRIIPKTSFPKTVFTIGTSLQKNIGLDKQKFTGIIDYKWRSSEKISHSFELLNAQYIQNLNINSYFDIYKSEFKDVRNISKTYFDKDLTPSEALSFIKNNITSDFEKEHFNSYIRAKNIEERYNIITEDIFVPSIAYTFIFNNSKNYKDTDFSFLRARVVSSGNLSSLFTKKNSNGVKTLFNFPFAQYVKLDFEWKRFWNVSENNVFAFRSFLGIAVPYGNSKALPFSRSYFIGGSNDLRAWKVYDLGPGFQKTGLEYNVGDLKFLTSLEYRFGIANSLKGALFADIGNIWKIKRLGFDTENSKFKFKNILASLAVGTGFGIRYDLSFLLLRLDIGFKTYEPYLEKNNRWFEHYNFGNAVYNFGISYPF